MTADRSTEELWPANHDRFMTHVRELMRLWREILEREEELLARLDRADDHDGETLAADSAALHDYQALAREIRAGLQRVFDADPDRGALPPEWEMLLSDRATESERTAAAYEYAGRAGLQGVLHPRRYEKHRESIEANLRSETRPRREVLRDIIAQALRIAAVEARSPQQSVTIERRRYVRGNEGSPIVPRRDLPRPLLRRWINAQLRNYVMERLDPGARERERLEETHGVVIVSLDEAAQSEAPERDVEVTGQMDATLADLERRLSQVDMRIARLRAEGLTHREIAKDLERSPDDIRKRWSRLRRQLSHPPGKE